VCDRSRDPPYDCHTSTPSGRRSSTLRIQACRRSCQPLAATSSSECTIGVRDPSLWASRKRRKGTKREPSYTSSGRHTRLRFPLREQITRLLTEPPSRAIHATPRGASVRLFIPIGAGEGAGFDPPAFRLITPIPKGSSGAHLMLGSTSASCPRNGAVSSYRDHQEPDRHHAPNHPVKRSQK
jgi:hypothetical protein